VLIPVRARAPGLFPAAMMACGVVIPVVGALIDAGAVDGFVVAGAVVRTTVVGTTVVGTTVVGITVAGAVVPEAGGAVGALEVGTEVAGE
jgi:hypothetical protein